MSERLTVTTTTERAMTIRWAAALGAFGLAGVAAAAAGQTVGTIEQMPAELETRFALSAAPPGLRGGATVHLLDPKKGYRLSRQGTSGVTCIVQRTSWEQADFRDDVYFPLCFDAAGARTYLRYTMDAAALRARGMSAAAVKAEIERRYRETRYTAPEKAGVSYMVGPIMRAPGPPDLKVRTMSMPHLMFYAPHVTNADIGAVPDLGVHASLLYPFVQKEGVAEQSYMIQLFGESERAGILASEAALVKELCAYRAVLCLADGRH
jgi:hypothetical protein